MAQLVVSKLDDDVEERLRLRAVRHGHSLEEEVREILLTAVLTEDPEEYGLGTRIAARFANLPPGPPLVIEELRGYPAVPWTFEGRDEPEDDEDKAG